MSDASIGYGEGQADSIPPPVHPASQVSTCSPTRKLSEPVLCWFVGGFITQVCLIKSGAVGDELNLQFISVPRSLGLGLKVPTL